MKVEKKIVELQNELNAARNAGKSIGFVPTMGALHEGHASLIKRSVQDNDITVVSVFLNPTQFNDKADLERYPKHWMKMFVWLKFVVQIMFLHLP